MKEFIPQTSIEHYITGHSALNIRSMQFIEKEGIDVEQGEVCCSEECASQFETL